MLITKRHENCAYRYKQADTKIIVLAKKQDEVDMHSSILPLATPQALNSGCAIMLIIKQSAASMKLPSIPS
jgi:hypothetical protein